MGSNPPSSVHCLHKLWAYFTFPGLGSSLVVWRLEYLQHEVLVRSKDLSGTFPRNDLSNFEFFLPFPLLTVTPGYVILHECLLPLTDSI